MNRIFYKNLSFIFAFVTLCIIFLSAGRVDAQIDPTFGTNGLVTINSSQVDVPLETFVLPDGKFLVVNRGGDIAFSYYFIKYNADGTPDTNYGTGGSVQLTVPASGSGTPKLNKAVRQPDGKIILAGQDSSDGIVLRYNENGSLDTSFASGGVHRPSFPDSNDGINSAIIQTDGKILIGGFTTNSSVNRLFLMRYLLNGTVDSTFGTNGSIIHETIASNFYTTMCVQMFLQSTGKILCSNGNVSSGANSSVRRFNSDGSIDNTFAVITTRGWNAVQPDDKILVAHLSQRNESLERTHFDGVIIRYNADGTLDTGFGGGGTTYIDLTGCYSDDWIKALHVLPDGQILVGTFTYIGPNRSSFRGTYASLLRLSPSGAVNGNILVTKIGSVTNLDATIYTDITPSFMSVLPDGKILTTYGRGNLGSDVLISRAIGVPPQTYKFRGVPFDFGITGIALPTIFRPSDREWYVQGFPLNGYFFGLADDIPVPSDYIKNFGTELAMFRPSNGTWYISRTFFNASTNYLTIQWGLNGDIPVPNDYDGDGKSDLAVFRPSNGTWYIRNSADSSATIQQWGLNGDKPAVGDFDGDGKNDIAVFRPSDGNWYIVKSSDGQAIILHFGLNGDVPVQEDYDGDGKTDIAVWRPSDGVWYRLNSSDGSFFAFKWGIATDVAVPADYDGDLKIDIAVWRPSEGRWYVYQSSNNSVNYFSWGLSTDVVIQAKY